MALLEEFKIDRFNIRTGIALVIVNRWFRGSRLPHRPGAEFDRAEIKSFCVEINCNPHVYDDLTAREIRNVCRNFSEMGFCDYDGFLFFISSHGDWGNVIYGVDGEYVTVSEIVSHFKKKQTLVNKPKLFFMQNCRGRNVDRGQTAHRYQDEVQADHGLGSQARGIRFPIEADILIAYSSVDGYESYRSELTGSWFIIKLIEIARQVLNHLNLTDFLSLVNKKVAMLNAMGRKQMPCFTSTLRKPVHFRISRPASEL